MATKKRIKGQPIHGINAPSAINHSVKRKDYVHTVLKTTECDMLTISTSNQRRYLLKSPISRLKESTHVVAQPLKALKLTSYR